MKQTNTLFCLCIDNLWYRQGLTPSYPQGSAWELISNNVTKVSVGPLDQVGVVQRLDLTRHRQVY